jgi:hypothetical protein
VVNIISKKKKNVIFLILSHIDITKR